MKSSKNNCCEFCLGFKHLGSFGEAIPLCTNPACQCHTELCDIPTPLKNDDWEKEFDNAFIEIMGLETDPYGTKNMYLIRDEDNEVVNGIDFSDERKELIAIIKSLLEQHHERWREEMGHKVHEIYDTKYAHFTREVRDTDMFRDEVIALLNK